MCTDGHLGNYGNHYLIKIGEKSLGQIESVLKPLFRKLFDVEAKVYRMYRGGFGVQINSKPIFRFLNNALKIRVGKIPSIVFDLDHELQRYFLAGVFDAEGYASKDRYRITITQANIEFLYQLQKLFARLGIWWNGPTTHTSWRGIWYTIRLEKKSEIARFAVLIGSCHVDKIPRLRNMVVRMALA